MILTTKGNSFLYTSKLVIIKEDGTEESTDNYEVTEDPVFEEASMTDKVTLVLDEESELSLNLGDNIIISANGFEYYNTITVVNPGNKQYKIFKPISQYSGTIQVKKNYYTYTIKSTMENGYYHFPNNELIIVNDSFLNVSIDYNTLSVKDKRISGLLEPSDIPNYNKIGLDEIYADFSTIPDFFRYLDGPVIKVLLLKKILALIEEAHFDNSTKYLTSYEKAKEKYILNFKTDKDGKTDIEEQISESEGGWSFSLGTR